MTDEAPSEPAIPITVESVRILALIEELRAESRALRAELEGIRSQQEKLQRALDETQEMLLLEIAQDRKRITALEGDGSVGKRTAERHLDALHSTMVSSGIRQITFGRAARLLGISYSYACRLGPAIESDSRFHLVKDQTHKQRWLIRLSR